MLGITKRPQFLALCLVGVLGLSACSSDSDSNSNPDQNQASANVAAAPTEANLVDLVVGLEQFSTLEALLGAAGLVETVRSGEFTVFAPTNEAFSKLPASVVEFLLNNPSALQDVLLYHVVAGTSKAEQVLATESLQAVKGGSLAISLRDNKPFINDSQIITTDVLATNGVVHVIDTVLIPPGFSIPDAPPSAEPETRPNLVDLVVNTERFSTLESLLGRAGLVDAVKNGELTVFAPNDAAFAKLPRELVAYLLFNPEALKSVLLYHVLPGTVKAEQVLASRQLDALSAQSIQVSLRNDLPFVNDSQIIATDVLAANGVVHEIDSVLIPPGFQLPSIAEAVQSTAQFSILLDLLQRTGLAEVASASDITVFAPTNAAFEALFKQLNIRDTSKLTKHQLQQIGDILKYHVVLSRVTADKIAPGARLHTVAGLALRIRQDRTNGGFKVNNTPLSVPGIGLANGIVYPIDAVLLPPNH